MIGGNIEVNNLIKICNSDIKKKCVDESEKIRTEIIKQLLVTHKIMGITADSCLYTSSMELYTVKDGVAISVAYLHLRCRDSNKLYYSISEKRNSLDSESKELEYIDFKNAANIIVGDLLEKFNC